MSDTRTEELKRIEDSLLRQLVEQRNGVHHFPSRRLLDYLVAEREHASTYESLGTPEEFEALKAEHEAGRFVAENSDVLEDVNDEWLRKWFDAERVSSCD